MFPGPVTRFTGSQTPGTPYANIATAWAPPTAYTSSTPRSRQTARIEGCGSPPNSRCGGEATAMEGQPGDLGRDDVHDHAGGQRRETAGHVEPYPVDRDHPLRHARARCHLDVDGRRAEPRRRRPAGDARSRPRTRPAGRRPGARWPRRAPTPAPGRTPARLGRSARSTPAARPRPEPRRRRTRPGRPPSRLRRRRRHGGRRCGSPEQPRRPPGHAGRWWRARPNSRRAGPRAPTRFS